MPLGIEGAGHHPSNTSFSCGQCRVFPETKFPDLLRLRISQERYNLIGRAGKEQDASLGVSAGPTVG